MPLPALNRRDFLKRSATGMSVLSAWGRSAGPEPSQEQTGVAEGTGERERARRAFDPLLDPRCRRSPGPPATVWQARWIWFPGQLACHLHAKGLRAAMKRCTSVGYPGTFRQPLSHVYLRTHAEMDRAERVRWTGPPGRIRLIINGSELDITSRSETTGPGRADVLASIDFAEGLPCLLLEGGPLSTGASWEASLDRQQWAPAECEPVLQDPDALPDGQRELSVEVPFDAAVRLAHVAADGSSFDFEPGGELIVDFRHDELGRIAFEANGSGKLSIFVGESLAEVNSSNPEYFEQWGLPEIGVTGQSGSVLLPERCVRYARIRSSGRCRLEQLRLVARVSPVEYKGRFECSDPLLNDIWAAGAATLHACMHGLYLDGIRRDALPWHDGLIALEAGDLVFGEATVARQTILALSLPPDPAVQDLGIVDAPLYALTAFENDYLARGDLEFSRRYRDRIHGTLRFFMSLQDERGFVSGRDAQPYGFFPDWSASTVSGPDPHGTPAYAQMLLMRAFEIGAAFAERWREPSEGALYGGVARNLRRNIRESFWDASAQAYINGLDQHGTRDARLTSFAQVNAILFDLAAPPEWGALFEGVLDNPARRSRNWSIGQQWESLAYAKAGRTGALMERLTSVWGGILKQGYTRFWEDIRPQDDALGQLAFYGRPFANSLCHGWAGAAPILGLVRGVLGLWPRAAGYAETDLEPHLGQLEWARGSIPTPTGAIDLELDRKGGTLTLPANVTVKLHGYRQRSGKQECEGAGVFSLESV